MKEQNEASQIRNIIEDWFQTTEGKAILNANFEAYQLANKTQLVLNTYAGYGDANNNKIMRFTNKVEGYGTAFTENHTSGYSGNTKGLEITTVFPGRYSFIFASIGHTTNPTSIGLSIDSNQLTTAINSISVGTRLSGQSGGAQYAITVPWAGYLGIGRVIRTHADGQTPVDSAQIEFTATYLGP